MRNRVLFPFALSLFAGPAGAQSFNLDMQPEGSPFGVPGPSYGGPADAPGTWMPITSLSTANLVATDGTTTGVSLTADTLVPYFQSDDVPATTGGDEALFDDNLRAIDTVWRFEGLEPGHYRVYSEAVALSALASWMYADVDASLQGHRLTLYAYWGGGFEHRWNYAVHDVLVTDGTLEIHHYPNESLHDDAATSGIQLVRVDDEPGGPFCSCDDYAPCDNGTPYLSGCLNGAGTAATLLGTGSASVAADDLRFISEGLVPNEAAILFVGDDAAYGEYGTWFGNGLLCVQGDVRRLGLRVAGPGGSAFWGPGLAALGGWSAGLTQRFQVWYRDPGGPCGYGWNFTEGYAVLIGP